MSTTSAAAGTSAPAEVPVASLFDRVIGQPAAVAALRAAARQPVHAYLFRGTAGSGTREASLAFAAALLCPFGGCGECETCRRTLAGTHPDLVVVERSGASVGVDDARRLVGLAQRRPFEGQRQILVVADIHLAVRSAPALLKTLEEPPPSTVFVLLAEDLPPELVTVASRCIQVLFPPVSRQTVSRWLVARGVQPERAELVAEGAGGDLERARLLAEDDDYGRRLELWRSIPGRLDGHGATVAAAVRSILDSSEAALAPVRAEHERELQRLAEQAEALGERGIPGRREVVERHNREERRWRTDELRAGMAVLARAYRDRILDALRAAGSVGQPTAPGDGRPGGAPSEIRSYETAVDLITAAAAALIRNPNESLLLEALLVRLGRLDA